MATDTPGPPSDGAAPAMFNAAGSSVPAGWFADPWGISSLRWWDGTQWTGYVSGAAPRPWIPPRDDPTPGIGDRFLLVITIAALFGGIALLFGVGLAARAAGASPLGVLVISEVALWSALTTTCVYAVRRYGTGSLRDLGLRVPRVKEMLKGSVGGLALRFGAGVIAAPLVFLFRDDFTRDTSVTRNIELDGGRVAVVVLIVCVGAPFFEELFFRGLLMSVLTSSMGARRALVVQALLFASVHLWVTMSLGQVVVTFTVIAFTGIGLGSLRWRYERLGPGMFAHAVFNVIAVIVSIAVLT